MLPLLTAGQIRQADAYSIAHEPISSIDLMERASKAFVNWFVNHFTDKAQSIAVYCGTGNNGGDGLAIARLLKAQGYTSISAKIARFSSSTSIDFDINFEKLQSIPIAITELQDAQNLPAEDAAIIIDALLGTGLNKPLSGDFAVLVNYLNQLKTTIVAVDVPTGMFAEGQQPGDAVILQSDLVITFQQPKISFLLPDTGSHITCWEAVNIGLNDEYLQSLDSPYQYVQEGDINKILLPRRRFSHKGTYGHALIVAGQAKTMGAALLCSSACVYTGAGLTTTCVPESGLTALNSHQPEVMALIRQPGILPEISWDKFNVIAAGPGLGTDDDAVALLRYIVEHYQKPLVIDADGLNILARHTDLLQRLPAGSVITPHMKEFDRLFGNHNSWWQRLQTMHQQAQELSINIVLKNDYTITATPRGKLYFNSSGNAAMAGGGMGDVLTGIITALLAQQYKPEDACLLGVYVHGKAGDELALPNRKHVVLPSQLMEQVPQTMARLVRPQ